MPNKFVGDESEGAATVAWLKAQAAAAPPSPAEVAQAMLDCTIAGDADGLAALRAMAGHTGGETRDDTPKEPTRDTD